MSFSGKSIARGAVWTIGAYGLIQITRLITNVLLARLLAPELLGIMLIVNSLRVGLELLTDVGIGQNIVYHKNGDDPEFYNTAWTIQLIRSLILWFIALIISFPLARFYQLPILASVIPIIAFSIVLGGLTSVSRELLQKRLRIATLNAFEAATAVISSALAVVMAYVSPTIWALVFGNLFASAITMVGSYLLLTEARSKFLISRRFASDILHYGKWVFASSVLFFFSSNLDRLYLATAIPLEVLGVYGIARSLSEMVGLVVQRLANYVLFPFIASHSQLPRDVLRARLADLRRRFLLLLSPIFAALVTVADLPLTVLYDERYRAATWMFPILIIGSWFSTLSYLNEFTLLGVGKPSYTALANMMKLAFLSLALPLAFASAGLIGCIVVIASADFFRYAPLYVGQLRACISFGRQDALSTIAMFACVGLFELLRCFFGFGTSIELLLH